MEPWLQSDASTDAAIERFERMGSVAIGSTLFRSPGRSSPSKYTRSGSCRSACPTAAVSRSRYAMKFCSEIFTLFAHETISRQADAKSTF